MLLFWHHNIILTRFFSDFMPQAGAILRWMAQYEQQTDGSEQNQANNVKFPSLSVGKKWPLMPCALVIWNGLVGGILYIIYHALCWCILIHQCISWITFLVDLIEPHHAVSEIGTVKWSELEVRQAQFVMSECTALPNWISERFGGVSDVGFSSCAVPTYYLSPSISDIGIECRNLIRVEV